MENTNTCTRLESYLHSINKLIKECYLDMANIRSFGRYLVGTQVKASYLERELGSMTYIKEQWALYYEYEEPFRLSMARGCLMTSTRSFFEYYEEHKEELDSLFRQKDLVMEYDEIGHAYDSYEASFAEIITPGSYRRLAAKLKELHSYLENYGSGDLLSDCKVVQAVAGEQQLKPEGVEDQDVTKEKQVKQGPELLPSGEYFTAEFLSHLYDAIKKYLSEEYSEFSWACIWNLVRVEGAIKFKKQRGPKKPGSARLYYLVYKLTEYLRVGMLGEAASQWEITIIHMMGLDWQTYSQARTKCNNVTEQFDKPAYADFAESLQEFFKTYANNSN